MKNKKKYLFNLNSELPLKDLSLSLNYLSCILSSIDGKKVDELISITKKIIEDENYKVFDTTIPLDAIKKEQKENIEKLYNINLASNGGSVDLLTLLFSFKNKELMDILFSSKKIFEVGSDIPIKIKKNRNRVILNNEKANRYKLTYFFPEKSKFKNLLITSSKNKRKQQVKDFIEKNSIDKKKLFFLLFINFINYEDKNFSLLINMCEKSKHGETVIKQFSHSLAQFSSYDTWLDFFDVLKKSNFKNIDSIWVDTFNSISDFRNSSLKNIYEQSFEVRKYSENHKDIKINIKEDDEKFNFIVTHGFNFNHLNIKQYFNKTMDLTLNNEERIKCLGNILIDYADFFPNEFKTLDENNDIRNRFKRKNKITKALSPKLEAVCLKSLVDNQGNSSSEIRNKKRKVL